MTFLYDGDCGFCHRSGILLQRLAPGLILRPANLRHHAVFRSGGVDYLGHHAIAQALFVDGRNLPLRGAGRILGLRIFDPAAAFLYRQVAKRRRGLSKLIGAPVCAVPEG
ncbi:hypothetical protein [Corynebacterium alimapuense]|uniref:hypothetical protein n=1 Tax=Corynebacterium alimapuense TaxID=1576874 RepID=UPI000F7FE736|nr:hypothetical protein [Corynebacterium alimapuense]